MVLVLINKDVFESNYNDSKFRVRNHNYSCTNLTNFSFLILWGLLLVLRSRQWRWHAKLRNLWNITVDISRGSHCFTSNIPYLAFRFSMVRHKLLKLVGERDEPKVLTDTFLVILYKLIPASSWHPSFRPSKNIKVLHGWSSFTAWFPLPSLYPPSLLPSLCLEYLGLPTSPVRTQPALHHLP